MSTTLLSSAASIGVEFAFLLIKIFPNDTIESHAIITMIAAPHLYLSRSFAPGISFVTDAWAVGVPGTLWRLRRRAAANVSWD